MIRKRTTLFAIAAVLAFGAACSEGGSEPPEQLVGGPHYFGSFEALKHRPELPLHPLTEQELRDRRGKGETYVVAFFGPKGRLLTIEAKQGESTLWKSSYTYRADGTVEAGETTHEGGRKTYQFDSSGVQVGEKAYDKEGKELH